jgi:cellulose synthase/poly-beta-1,6-N-acetylglucosamine synthase-like glycosyltransferase
VVVRKDDKDTLIALEKRLSSQLSLRSILVAVPGQVAALNTALKVAQGDIIAFTDDDAKPHITWLESMSIHFLTSEKIGAVGGKDWVYRGKDLLEGRRRLVGKVQWFGRIIGNHHLGIGEPRTVDLLKGVNMGFRREAIKGMYFDERLKGTGAQVHCDLDFCLRLKRTGWLLIYDPKVAVDHYPAQRFDEDRRGEYNTVAQINAVHNETLILLQHFSPLQRYIYLIWSISIGTREAPGCLQFFRFLPHEGYIAASKILATLQGRLKGIKTLYIEKAS